VSLHDLFREYTAQIFAVAFVVGIIGNAVAALVCGVPAFLHLHKRLKTFHKTQLDQSERHHAAQMAQAERHHRSLLSALGADPEHDDTGSASTAADPAATTIG
jgi:phage terminase Nu1 subunit (DNA packaging protein)